MADEDNQKPQELTEEEKQLLKDYEEDQAGITEDIGYVGVKKGLEQLSVPSDWKTRALAMGQGMTLRNLPYLIALSGDKPTYRENVEDAFKFVEEEKSKNPEQFKTMEALSSLGLLKVAP